MIICRKLIIGSSQTKKIIFFGEVDNNEEYLEVCRLRYLIYKDRGYIDDTKYTDNENDEYDISGKCRYFIAKYNERIIGTIRLIRDTPLPTERVFSFDEPSDMALIPKENRFELGRFIIIPLNKECGEYLPRGLVMLFLFDILSSYAINNNLAGGYSFVKRSLLMKLKKFNMPVREITKYRHTYLKDDVLYNYFTQDNNPVLPVYFFSKDFYKYSQKVIHNSWMFSITGDTFMLRSNLYTNFLRLLKII